jgi:hypothetical protein
VLGLAKGKGDTRGWSATWQKLMEGSLYWLTAGEKWATAGDHLLEK